MISSDVVIITRHELGKIKQEAFQRGVDNGVINYKVEHRKAREGSCEVWCEGHGAQGNPQPAHFIGCVVTDSFQDACDRLLGGDETYDSKTRTLWGCKLYENEAVARRSFG